jgi:hypothetical protein
MRRGGANHTHPSGSSAPASLRLRLWLSIAVSIASSVPKVSPRPYCTYALADHGPRAEPEPKPFEQVTTPTFVLTSDNEDDERTHGLAFVNVEDALPQGEDEEGADQTTRSRGWVEEEGEVFRKATRLLGPEEMEDDYDGDELRVEVRATLLPAVTNADTARQLLETGVERPPPRAILRALCVDL